MYKLLVTLLVFCAINPAYGKEAEKTIITASETVSNKMTSVEKRVREAAVRVNDHYEGGHGSGTLMEYKDLQLVITAKHVVPRVVGTEYEVEKGDEKLTGIVIYSNYWKDVAVLYLPEHFKNIQPMKWRPVDKILEVGEEITYSGYPSDHKLMTLRGRVIGYEEPAGMGTQMIIHTYGWFGCSGAGVFDAKGNVIGIIWGIDVEYRYEHAIVVEDLMWVTPIKNLKMSDAILILCNTVGKGSELKACQ